LPTLAKAKAREILRLYCIDSPLELNVEAIANAEGLIIESSDLSNCVGRSSFGQGCGIIMLSTGIKVVGQRRFTIAHEMGHFYNGKNREIFCKAEDLIGAKSKKNEEDEANAFAVELLMKKEWFTDFVKDKCPGIGTIKAAAEYFRVSLSAAAIRYSEAGNFPVAVIMVHKGRVSWSAISEIFPYQYVRRHYPVNSYSEAEAFYSGRDVNTEPHTVLADSWFLDDRSFRPNHKLVEQCLPMPNYHSVLVVVWEG